MVYGYLVARSWSADMKEFRFNLDIPVHEFMAYYEGVARTVYTVTVDGQTVQFPASVLRPYLTERGIYGEFILQCDEHHRFKGIRKVE